MSTLIPKFDQMPYSLEYSCHFNIYWRVIIVIKVKHLKFSLVDNWIKELVNLHGGILVTKNIQILHLQQNEKNKRELCEAR